MHTVGLYDRLTARLDGPRGACYHPAARRRMAVALEHDAGPEMPSGEINLAVRAAHALVGRFGTDAAAHHQTDGGVPAPQQGPITRLWLRKRIPVAAGMAGGSADAAAALVALNRLWECGLSLAELREVAATLGADVPFCVTGGTALATGTGAVTAPVICRGTYHWIVGIQREPLATAAVYEAWSTVARPGEIEPDAVLQALRTDDAEALGAALHNDLEPAAFHLRPMLWDAREAMLEAGALGAVVSGSGPTIVGLARDERHARTLADAVAGSFDRVVVVRSPAAGPELVAEAR